MAKSLTRECGCDDGPEMSTAPSMVENSFFCIVCRQWLEPASHRAAYASLSGEVETNGLVE